MRTWQKGALIMGGAYLIYAVFALLFPRNEVIEIIAMLLMHLKLMIPVFLLIATKPSALTFLIAGTAYWAIIGAIIGYAISRFTSKRKRE